jgi:hypothetical protein
MSDAVMVAQAPAGGQPPFHTAESAVERDLSAETRRNKPTRATETAADQYLYSKRQTAK